MLSTAFLSLSVLASAAFAGSSKGYQPFPLKDGFPNPSAKQLTQIEVAAGGSLPNGGLPTKLTPGAAVTFQLIALNELFEVAFFNELLYNVTECVKGYELEGAQKKYVIESLTAILAQEELHAIGANAILASAKQQTISPCRYQFPVSDFESAIALANTFTDIVLGVLPLAQITFATDGGQETGLIQLVGSIIGQEGEQNGWYRYVQAKKPSAAPFLTTSNPAYAFTALQSFIVPGSCPNIQNLQKNIPTFQPLEVQGTNVNKGVATFAVPGKLGKDMMVAYLTGQLEPVIVNIGASYKRGAFTYFTAPFPFKKDIFSDGLTVAAVVKDCTKATTAAQVAANTVYGPGLIEIN